MTENELLDEIVAATEVDDLGEDEVTADMLADRTGLTHSAAYFRLREMERHGELISRIAIRRSRHVRAWRRSDR